MDLEPTLLSLLADGGPVARRLEGYVPRRAQIDMALEVADALRTPGRRLVVEAGTGTGKSLAYLAAALLSGEQVVIATGTRALQDQLIQKDIPLVLDAIEEATGLQKTAALMKGRGNYLCLARFDQFEQAPRFAFAEEAGAWPVLRAWAKKTESGDRAELDGLPEVYATWSDLDASSETCIGQKCPRYSDCFITKMRKAADAADVIVVNHHLLCADERVRLEGLPAASEAPGETPGEGPAGERAGFGQVIPQAGAIIIDEAHALPDVASDYFGVSLTSAQIERLLRDMRKAGEGLPTSRRLALLGAAQRLQLAFDGLYQALELTMEGNERARLSAAHARPLREPCHVAIEQADALAGLLESYAECDEDAVPTVAVAELSGLQRRCEQASEALDFLLGPALEDARFVTFVEGRKRGLSLGAVPVDVAEALARTLFRGMRPVVLTSATLSVAKGTGPFERKAGLRGVRTQVAVDDPTGEDGEAEGSESAAISGREVRSVVYPSPFDHARRSALYAPAGMPEPDSPHFLERFDAELRFLLELSRGGALLLFTSHRAMEAAFARLAPGLHAMGLPCFKQGDAPKSRLLDELRAADGEAGAVLFATHSFWEGVDVRGRALRVVVIDRLPFRMPTDPVQIARQELVRARGGHPFRDLSLPEAAITLKQGAGRLLRSHEDAGVVAILDGRLRSKAYGKLLLDSLPPMTRVGSQKVLRDFWSRCVAPTLGLGGWAMATEGDTRGSGTQGAGGAASGAP